MVGPVSLGLGTCPWAPASQPYPVGQGVEQGAEPLCWAHLDSHFSCRDLLWGRREEQQPPEHFMLPSHLIFDMGYEKIYHNTCTTYCYDFNFAKFIITMLSGYIPVLSALGCRNRHLTV